MRRAVFLDRDGVINQAIVHEGKPYPPQKLEEFHILPNVKRALHCLKEAGFLLIVVTNQPDVRRGKQTKEMVDAMHDFLRGELPLDDIEVSFDEKAFSYKPLPGMLFKAALKHEILLCESYLVGDRWRDIEAAKNGGCFSIFIDYGYREKLVSSPNFSCKNLLEAATFILQHKERSNEYQPIEG